MNLSNPYEAFKEQMRQKQRDKAAQARRKKVDDLEEAKRRLEEMMREEIYKNLYGDLFGSPGSHWYANNNAYTNQSTYTSTKPTTPGWCKVLGLPATATQAEIKSKYRTLVKQHHPDKGGNPDTFNKITRAYNEALL